MKRIPQTCLKKSEKNNAKQSHSLIVFALHANVLIHTAFDRTIVDRAALQYLLQLLQLATNDARHYRYVVEYEKDDNITGRYGH